MVYTSQNLHSSPNHHSSVNHGENGRSVAAEPSPSVGTSEYSALLDPALLQAARQIYRTYYEVHYNQVQRPLGVVLHRVTYRGQLIFKSKPILLPQECFVPLNQIES